jgi:imidazolonepropionase-like amidohydrolase
MIIAALLALGAAHESAAETYAVRAGRVIPVSSGEIQDGVLLVRNGQIAALGAWGTVDIPAGVRVVDLSGSVIVPGIVDIHPAFAPGVANEETTEVTPDVRVAEWVNPDAPEWQRARALGITTAVVSPGTRNVIGGLSAAMKTDGTSVVRDPLSLVASMGQDPSVGNWPPRAGQPNLFARRPTTRMGVVWQFRDAFVHAPDRGDETLVRALEGELPVWITARRATDIETALNLAEEFGLRLTLVEAHEAGRLAVTIRERGVSVVLRPHVRVDTVYSDEGTRPRISAARSLLDAGVRVAICGASLTESGSGVGLIALLVRSGLTREEALRALTLTPAEIAGIGDRVGSLEPGKDADFVILDGDPSAAMTAIRTVVIRGTPQWGSLPIEGKEGGSP